MALDMAYLPTVMRGHYAVRAEDGKNRGGRREGRDGRDARRNGQDEGGPGAAQASGRGAGSGGAAREREDSGRGDVRAGHEHCRHEECPGTNRADADSGSFIAAPGSGERSNSPGDE
ncbi:hypothetical protein GMDG_03862 [Pseudogymnoascus destructans 20631-21]|uniref:Uncharacterized protein n=1 Tax=Pseudogymnoascus destructans (strain ATCC MYA-4855 / 20631-21) TaxID=658429 RepID=L8G8V1_PSED2|nr:hypothetical protein GMDG_03862 [Pseudogymnoascus destructans 20631-21]